MSKPRRTAILLLLCLAYLSSVDSAFAQSTDCPAIPREKQEELKQDHLGPYQLPGYAIIHRAYAVSFDSEHLVPRWVAWRVTPDFRTTPSRTGQWSRFRSNPYLPVAERVVTADYTGSGYQRGHMAPYFIAGGDRDGDGKYAEDDLDDACTVYEINYLSNIAPQLGTLNSGGGSWFELEGEIRAGLNSGHSYQIVAGTLFLSNEATFIRGGANRQIGIPDAFFQIVDNGQIRMAYLFFHDERIATDRGCLPNDDFDTCIVPIELVEKLSGLPLSNRD